MALHRRRNVGAELIHDGVSFRVWAPAHKRVSVVIGKNEIELDRESGGYFSVVVPGLSAGTRYRFRLDDEREMYPDPASRFQPEGPHGPSEIIDPSAYRWRTTKWRGVSAHGLVIYEMHIGTFSARGDYAAAAECLPQIADVCVNLIELMPVHEFAGAFGWGYDGVDLWAPTRLYGSPDDLRRFVDRAHELGMGVILDVVYNHFGPDGCYVSKFTPRYFTKKYKNEWGEAINYDGEDSAAVRDFFAENAAYWIDEFRFDGLRIDATQSIKDASRPHVIREIADRARAAAGDRPIYLVAENEPQDVRILNEFGLDAMWNDDWHHSAVVASTGLNEAYYTDYLGTPQEFVSIAKLGFLYQGQRYSWQKKRRGTPSGSLDPKRLVCYLENHDQIANSARGERLHQRASPGVLRAMTALLLLQPQTPMLFQGQEFGATAPFLYFAGHEPELAAKVADGRREFLSQFPSIAAIIDEVPRPDDEATFTRSKLDFSERERRPQFVDLHRDLIALRRSDPTIAQQRSDNLHGAVIAPEAFVLRWFNNDEDRLLLINLGRELRLERVPEPLLAPPPECRWETLWSSESPRYGGSGSTDVESEDKWVIPAHAAVLLRPRSMRH